MYWVPPHRGIWLQGNFIATKFYCNEISLQPRWLQWNFLAIKNWWQQNFLQPNWIALFACYHFDSLQSNLLATKTRCKQISPLFWICCVCLSYLCFVARKFHCNDLIATIWLQAFLTKIVATNLLATIVFAEMMSHVLELFSYLGASQICLKLSEIVLQGKSNWLKKIKLAPMNLADFTIRRTYNNWPISLIARNSAIRIR